jgi:hypothetical protein
LKAWNNLKTTNPSMANNFANSHAKITALMEKLMKSKIRKDVQEIKEEKSRFFNNIP